MKKNKKIVIPLIICVVIIGVIIGVLLYQKFSPSREKMELSEYFKTDKDAVTIILEDEICEISAITVEEQIYLPLEIVKERLNTRFYWDGNENLLLYSTPNAVISAEVGSKDCYQNNSKKTKDYEIVHADAENIYVAIDYIKEHTALAYEVYENPKRVVLTYEYGIDKEYIKTDSECALRFKADIKSDILVELQEEETLRLLEEEDEETGFCKVMDKTGVIGFVRAKDLGKAHTGQQATEFKEEEYTHILKDEKITLAWHQVTNQTANSGLLNMLANTKGINVICPTWFATSDNNGNIDSLASDTYVTQAHQEGIEVWGLCNDFSPNMKIGKVLGTTSKRQKLAKNLIAEAIRYSLDGINIDFENVREESGEDFIQFIRELGIMCRNNGIVLSIDNYPVANYSQYYNRTEQANVADYVITMAYDEYYSGSEEAGPVSSISYVRDSTKNVLEQVPAKQAIIALPFYSRHWTERTKDGKVTLSAEACSMSYAQQILADSKTAAVWDEETGMNYLEYKEGKALHKMWIEDINSLQLKMEEVAKNDTAGVAFWKLGMEDRSVWDMIYKYNK